MVESNISCGLHHTIKMKQTNEINVQWNENRDKDYKKVHLGLFEKEEEAREAYLKAKKELHIIKEREKNG